jgi:hypothetical protein
LSTVRLLPVGAPVTAGLVMTGRGGMILLLVLCLLVTLLALRAVLLRTRTAEEDPRR